MGSRDDLRQYLSIDKNALDECLMEQPQIYAQVADSVANAEADRDSLQLTFDETWAELDKTVRSRPLQEAEKRLTDKAIEQQLRTLPKIKALSLGLQDAKREAKLWRALEKAFEQRADMLKKLVDLHLRSTYGYALESGVMSSRSNYVNNQAEVNRAAANAKRKER